MEQKHSLALLSPSDTQAVLDRIAEVHEQAYGWRIPPAAREARFYSPAMSAAERMRTKVRYCVEALDLAHLYREVPEVQSREMPLPRLTEDPQLFAGKSDDIVVEEVDR